MSAKAGIVGAIYKQDDASTNTFTDQASTLQSDNRTVIINSDLYKSFKNDKSLFTIKKNGGAITDDYDLYLDRVVFKQEQTSGTWTISGTFIDLELAGGCYEWNIDIKHDVQDDTEFTDKWKVSLPGLLSWVVTAKRRHINEDFFNANTNFILRLFWDIDNTESWYGLAKMTDIKNGDKIDGVTDGEISFEGIGLVIKADWALPVT